ncbi:amino acid ABC transporter substrate-binding protein [Mesorhizobium sp.]|uniref:amino acid ABC transporter substrate-binding protein n=1 Tax=Mesorhizobium sp. TaxID=1871066 RepID=UPI000FE637B7|nr:amino acid ABC transporter substrate-binding protein [Mesorhizobium sp.]RWK43146.1 MAG: amino acid ABC transporter substrate-binding protein [Mesorhizobium sp.]RWK71337.1 MAG: amino acid ABC transporter substrate-binding protein [Mesorhizobium sp.]RWK77746.1 MAG: amino acid ABC transporter substrate-binding protein [Mesorhizobium sp.]RWK83487.1 MAG: amino acid ABC transporter substrate-binding protein [Mesorhizobium sp.]RWL07158.1 MAG: amino acid ABC transporter substrate-binding protein [M
MTNRFINAALVLMASLGLTTGANAGAILNAVKERGEVVCGINTGFVGFSMPDDRGEWRGLDVDFCRGLAAALFGDPSKVQFVPLTPSTRFTALTAGEVDVLFRNSTETMLRDVTLGLRAVTPYFYDGHTFMVSADSGVTKAAELDGATICLLQGTTNEQITADFFRKSNLGFTPVVFERSEQARDALDSGRCDSFGSDSGNLAAVRLSMRDPKAWSILDERFSKEPYGPYIRRGDDEWYDVIRWYVNAMFEAEENGITSENVEQIRATSADVGVKRLLGVTPELGEALGIGPAWVVNAVKAVGNYGEMFERHLGPNSKLGMSRSLNRQWTDGGLIYALPMR